MIDDRFWFAVVEEFATSEECDHVISLADGALKRSKVGVEDPYVSDVRTSSQCWLTKDSDKVVYDLNCRAAALAGIPMENAESMQVLRYGVGQEYCPHYDASSNDNPERAKVNDGWGQRIRTVLIYLNDVEGGGFTSFPNVGTKIPPKKGRALIFQNIDARNPTHRIIQPFGYIEERVINHLKKRLDFLFDEIKVNDEFEVPQEAFVAALRIGEE